MQKIIMLPTTIPLSLTGGADTGMLRPVTLVGAQKDGLRLAPLALCSSASCRWHGL